MPLPPPKKKVTYSTGYGPYSKLPRADGHVGLQSAHDAAQHPGDLPWPHPHPRHERVSILSGVSRSGWSVRKGFSSIKDRKEGLTGFDERDGEGLGFHSTWQRSAPRIPGSEGVGSVGLILSHKFANLAHNP